MKRRIDSSSMSNHMNGFTESRNGLDADPKMKPYFTEITDMMHYYGDVSEPKVESVALIYFILREQLNALLIKAESNMKLFGMSGEKEISHREILFLIKNNKPKLKRLLEFLNVLDVQPLLPKVPETDEDDSGDNDETVYEQKGKRVKMCKKFLRQIEDAGELSSLMEDERIVDLSVYRRRMQRNAVVDRMNNKEYLEFSKRTTKTTFCPRQRKEAFKEWLLKDQVTQKDITPTALSIIDFLARETIAQIIDVALYIKSKKNGETLLVPYDQIKISNPKESCMSPIGTSDENNFNGEAMDTTSVTSSLIVNCSNNGTEEKATENEQKEAMQLDTNSKMSDFPPTDNGDDDYVFIEDDSDSQDKGSDLKMFEGDSSGSPVEVSDSSKFEDEASKKHKLELKTTEEEKESSSNELLTSCLKESMRRSQELLSQNRQSEYVPEVEVTQDIKISDVPDTKHTKSSPQEFLPEKVVSSNTSPVNIENPEISNVSCTTDNGLTDSCPQECVYINQCSQTSCSTQTPVFANKEIRTVSENSINKQKGQTSHMKYPLSAEGVKYAKDKRTNKQKTEFGPADSSIHISKIPAGFQRILNNPRSAVYDDRDTIIEKKDKYAIIPNTAITPGEITDAYTMFREPPPISKLFKDSIKTYDKTRLVCLQDSIKLMLVN